LNGEVKNVSKKKERNILIIEDDEELASSLAEMLKSEGFSVDVAPNGMEALSRSEKSLYHLAIIDIRLPNADGTDLLGMLRETVPPMRKIILTGYPDLENAVKAVNLGANMYLIKPVEPQKLLEVIKDQLKKREEEVRYSQKKVGEYIKTRAAEAERGKRVFKE